MCKRSLYVVEVQEGDAETTGRTIQEALKSAGIVALEVGAYGLDDLRTGDSAPAQHYRPPAVCRSCGWPFTDWQGETYCDECAEAIGDEDENEDEETEAECTCCRHWRGQVECGGVDCQRCEGCNGGED